MLNSWTEMAPLPIVPPGCAVRAKAAPVQVWSPEGRKTRWLPLLKIPLTVMVVMELCMMMLGVRITVGGAGGGEGGGEGGGGDGGGDGAGEGGGDGGGEGGGGEGGGGEGEGGGGEGGGEGGGGEGGGGEGGLGGSEGSVGGGGEEGSRGAGQVETVPETLVKVVGQEQTVPPLT